MHEEAGNGLTATNAIADTFSLPTETEQSDKLYATEISRGDPSEGVSDRRGDDLMATRRRTTEKTEAICKECKRRDETINGMGWGRRNREQ